MTTRLTKTEKIGSLKEQIAFYEIAKTGLTRIAETDRKRGDIVEMTEISKTHSKLSITLPTDLLRVIELKRGDITRSKFIVRSLQRDAKVGGWS